MAVRRSIANLFECAVVLAPTLVSVALRLLGLEELLAVEVGDLLVGNPQGFAVEPLLFGFHRLLLLLNLDVRLVGKRLDRFDKGLVLLLLDEVYDIAALSTTETLEGVGVGENIERRRPLIVERTAADIASAGLAQLDVRADDLHDVRLLLYFVNDFLSYHKSRCF